MVALAVSAFAWVVPSLEGANRRFIEEAQSHGHAIAPGEQVLSVAPAEGDRVRRVFGGEDVFGARRSGWWVASG